MNQCSPKQVETQYIGDIPVDGLDSLPDYLLAERDVEDPSTGEIKRTPVRVPAGKLFPNGNYDNVIAMTPNNNDIIVPEAQVRAAYVANEGSSNVMYYASSTHKPVFLAIGAILDQILVQNSGFVNIPKGHSYVIGAQYYVGDNGEPVTDSSSGYKLFVPISATKLAINME